jgi:hypothetical protein
MDAQISPSKNHVDHRTSFPSKKSSYVIGCWQQLLSLSCYTPPWTSRFSPRRAMWIMHSSKARDVIGVFLLSSSSPFTVELTKQGKGCCQSHQTRNLKSKIFISSTLHRYRSDLVNYSLIDHETRHHRPYCVNCPVADARAREESSVSHHLTELSLRRLLVYYIQSSRRNTK